VPLHDVGYRGWQGARLGPWSAAAAIATTGIRLAWTSRWLRRAVFLAWSPALFFAASFFAFEQAIDEGRIESLQERAARGRNLDGIGLLGTILADTLGRSEQPSSRPALSREAETAATRRLVWSRLLLAFMRAPQAVLLAVVVGLVAPTLISRDLRAKAWLVYFTRPVGRVHYIAGKLAVLATIVAAVTVLPALALWMAGVLVSPSVWVIAETWDLPLKVIAASIALAIPTVLLALAYSSLTAESRIASFAWFATWAACWIAHSSLVTADLAAATAPEAAAVADAADIDDDEWRPPPQRINWLARAAGLDTTIDRWSWVSPYHAIGVIQAWIFGVETRPQAVVPPAIALASVSVAAALVLAWRVAAPMRA
jgi:ABC-type transport system involved in multi-copper enzyme maturation permease subunit